MSQQTPSYQLANIPIEAGESLTIVTRSHVLVCQVLSIRRKHDTPEHPEPPPAAQTHKLISIEVADGVAR